ncbi:MAG: pectate lyase precursor, partial [Candidatus Glassbacteria bacterium]
MKPCFVATASLLIYAAAYGAPATDSLPAFPGAEGWGANTPGGRGGRVIIVTNLNTSGPGSLQAACSAQDPRIVVFDTSGVIPGPVTIEHGRITIMGQTAPGAGITIGGKLATDTTGGGVVSDIVVRFLRVRPEQLATGDGSDQDAVQFNRVNRCVLDHLSIAWSTDENIGFYEARESTVQWCSVEEACAEGHYKGRHNYGLLCG